MPDDQELLALGRAVAATGSWVPRPGQRVRDPETGIKFRFDDDCVHDPQACYCASDADYTALRQVRAELGDTDADDEANDQWCRRAVAAGPDLSDEPTALSLLADMPGYGVGYDVSAHWWCPRPPAAGGMAYATRAEAIVQAWIARYNPEAF